MKFHSCAVNYCIYIFQFWMDLFPRTVAELHTIHLINKSTSFSDMECIFSNSHIGWYGDRQKSISHKITVFRTHHSFSIRIPKKAINIQHVVFQRRKTICLSNPTYTLHILFRNIHTCIWNAGDPYRTWWEPKIKTKYKWILCMRIKTCGMWMYQTDWFS